MRRSPVVLAVVLASLALAPFASPSPKALYTALVTTMYPDAQLPQGFSSAKVTLKQPSSYAKKHSVVGEVTVIDSGPDPYDAIVYGVFRRASDARADLTGVKPPGSIHLQGKVPGYKLPSVWLTGFVHR